MKRILRTRLPERLSGALPPLATELAVGIVTAALFFAARFSLEPLTGSSAPYALSFVAVVLASLLAGWRSGVIALILGQLLSWFYLVPHRGSFEFADSGGLSSLLLATFSELAILAVIALYQREVAASGARRERQIDFLGEALREIDHRTHNNFQTVLSLIALQANRAASAEVKAALQEAADRIRAVSLAYDKLALSSVGLEKVRLDEHLHELCEQIGRGIVPEGVTLRTDLVPATIRADVAISLGIIVNELVTNAVKHAFGERRGSIAVITCREGDSLELRIADDGGGMSASKDRRGLGTRLVDTFIRQLGGRHEVSTGMDGTIHRIRVPVAGSTWPDQAPAASGGVKPSPVKLSVAGKPFRPAGG